MSSHIKRLRHGLSPPPGRVLMIATRQIGDVLLTTPLLCSMRMAWPRARIDVLVFTGKGGVLEANPHIDDLIEIAERPTRQEHLALAGRIVRRYDLAVSTLPGDRPNLYALLAAPKRVTLLPDLGLKSAWKRWINQGWALLDDVYTHTVAQNLQLAQVLGIDPEFQVVPPGDVDPDERLIGKLGFDPGQCRTAVVHPFPMWRYKRWTTDGWLSLIRTLQRAGMRVVVTGGPDRAEMSACAELIRPVKGVIDMSGQLGFPELGWLLRRAYLFVGPDTGVTHLAAACGVPTLALYGPSNPVKWGPWPIGCDALDSPFTMYSPEPQHLGNVVLLQPAARECLPCREEGCERHRQSASECLEQMPVDRVVAALRVLLPDLVS